MSTEPVTVIMCVYNGQDYLDEAIWSVRRQTFQDWRLLIIDDGSADRSPDMADQHAAQDARIEVIRQANAGVSAARNRALKTARTRWVAMLDHDDLYLPDKLERQMTYLAAHPHLAALGTHGYRIGRRGQRLGYFDVGPQDVAQFERLYARGAVIYLLAASVVFDRELALRVGGFPHLQTADDVAMWTRLADHAPVLTLTERLVAYRVQAGSISGRKLHLQRLEVRFIEQNTMRRRAGDPELTFEEFMHGWEAQPAPVRHAFDRESASLNAYRVAGGLLADRQPAGLIWLARSIGLNPSGRLLRVASQFGLKRHLRRVGRVVSRYRPGR